MHFHEKNENMITCLNLKEISHYYLYLKKKTLKLSLSLKKKTRNDLKKRDRKLLQIPFNSVSIQERFFDELSTNCQSHICIFFLNNRPCSKRSEGTHKQFCASLYSYSQQSKQIETKQVNWIDATCLLIIQRAPDFQENLGFQQ